MDLAGAELSNYRLARDELCNFGLAEAEFSNYRLARDELCNCGLAEAELSNSPQLASDELEKDDSGKIDEMFRTLR